MTEERDRPKPHNPFQERPRSSPHRRSFRARLHGARVLIRGEDFDAEYRTVNLSEGGILVTGSPAPELGAELSFHLFGPEGDVVSGQAVVVRHIDSEEEAFALAFKELDEGSENAMSNLTTRCVISDTLDR